MHQTSFKNQTLKHQDARLAAPVNPAVGECPIIFIFFFHYIYIYRLTERKCQGLLQPLSLEALLLPSGCAAFAAMNI